MARFRNIHKPGTAAYDAFQAAHRLFVPWCGLPFRRNGGLYWPYQGTGWYWSCEIEAAQRWLFADVSVLDLWVAEPTCDCRQYDWVPPLYERRKQLGSNTRGYPLKIGLNSVYGKLAQHTGRGPTRSQAV